MHTYVYTQTQISLVWHLSKCCELSKCTSKTAEKRSNRAKLRKITKRHTHALNGNQKKKRSFTVCYIAVGSVTPVRLSLMFVAQFSEWISGIGVVHTTKSNARFPVVLIYGHAIARKEGPLCAALLSISSKWRLLNRRSPHNINCSLFIIHVSFLVNSLLFHRNFLLFYPIAIHKYIPCTWHVLITLHFYVFNLICQLFHRNQCYVH